MNFDFKKNKDFRESIKRKQDQIIDRTSDKVLESDGFKILQSGFKAMIQKNAFNSLRVIHISETEIFQIILDDIGDFNDFFSSDEFTYNHMIEINRKLEVISCKRTRLPDDSNEARETFSELSKSGVVVFLLLKDKINYFINGIDKSESPFFSLTDVNKYNEKKDINQINELFVKYQVALEQRRNYCKFFIDKSHLKSLRLDIGSPLDIENFITEHKHILRNKPEDTFREDLRLFLEGHLRVAQIKEFLLESFKRLDIYLWDEFGDVYLIEVKWVGQSIHQEGKRIGTEYRASNIDPEAFFQTLNYLDELYKQGQNIMKAYLVVFDARKEDLPDTGSEFDTTQLTEDQTKYFRKFQKVNDFRVCNTHPS